MDNTTKIVYTTKKYVDTVIMPEAFSDKLEIVLPRLIEVVKESASEIWLFGSAARNEVKWSSDIDLMVVTDLKKPEELKKISTSIRSMGLVNDTGYIDVDIVVRSRDYLNNDSELFTRYVKKDKRVLWGK